MERVGWQKRMYRAGTSKWARMIAAAVMLLVCFALLLPAAIEGQRVRERLGLETSGRKGESYITGPSIIGFERFETLEATVTEEQLETVFEEAPEVTSHGIDLVECSEIKQPEVPSKIPDWVTTIEALQASTDPEIEELFDGVFIKGPEMAIMICDFDTLFNAIDYTEPAAKTKPAKGLTDNPTWDIYFACGSGKHTITFTDRVDIGRKSKWGFGTFRLLAVDRNIEFNGGMQSGLLRVEQGAHVTVYGITFKDGAVTSADLSLNGMPRGGYQGAAILAMAKTSVIVYKCNFENNHSFSTSARYGGGGAIKGETFSKIIIWGCSFKKNKASVGGAVAVSSATVLYVAKSTFDGNVAIGGLDGSAKKKGRKRPKLLVKGGAIRVDSIEGHESDAEHVLFCNSKFLNNQIIFKHGDYERLGLTESESEEDLNAGAAAVYTWNAPENLKLDSGDMHFLSLKGCIFDGNTEDVDTETKKAGLYVFQAEGAGHAGVHDLDFKNNKVRGAVAKFDNSNKYTGHDFNLELRNIKFANNGDVKNLAFEMHRYESKCNLSNVEGIPDADTDCSTAAIAAVESGDTEIALVDESVPVDEAVIDEVINQAA